MLCEKCGAYMDDDVITCDACGSMLRRKPQPEAGYQGIRQGKPTSSPLVIQGRTAAADDYEAADAYGASPYEGYEGGAARPIRRQEDREAVQRNKRSQRSRYAADAGRPESRRGIPRVSEAEIRELRARQAKLRPVQKRMINWMKVWVIVVALLLLVGVGFYVFLLRVPAGQRLYIRMGGSGPAEAYWQVGDEYLQAGNLRKAIETYLLAEEEQAKAEVEKDQVNIDGMMALGSAYEALGTEEGIAMAEGVYRGLLTTVPEAAVRTDLYESLIRVITGQPGKEMEIPQLMQTAYEATGLTSFRNRRTDYLPAMPTTNLTGGTYEEFQKVILSSEDHGEIYYVIGEGDPVTDGELFDPENPIDILNGYTTIRAVCKVGSLYSDPLVISYTVSLPAPAAPKSSHAPKTYEKKQRVWLKHDDFDNVTIFYTIDGSKPTENSPIFHKDEPFYLPSGRCTLRAIAVDERGTPSNELTVEYKVTAGRIVEMYNEKNQFSGLVLMKTTRSDIEKKVGAPDSTEVMGEGAEGEAASAKEQVKLNYSWGYVIVEKSGTQWLVIELYETANTFSPPKDTRVGMVLDDVTAKYRDLGQVPNAKGDRGIYYDDKGEAKLTQLGDNKQLLYYTCKASDGNQWVLQYYLTDNVVTGIRHGIQGKMK